MGGQSARFKRIHNGKMWTVKIKESNVLIFVDPSRQDAPTNQLAATLLDEEMNIVLKKAELTAQEQQ
jgi:hypothetical protein